MKVEYEGPEEAEIAIVSHFPSSWDETYGKVMTGKQGEILNRCLASANLKRKNIRIMYLSREIPRKGHAEFHSLDSDLVGNELEYFKQSIKRMINLKVILALGDRVTEKFLRREDLLKIRGSVYTLRIDENEEKKVYIVPTIHPEFIIKSVDSEPVLALDMKKAVRVSREGFSEPEPKFNIDPTEQQVKEFTEKALSHDLPLSVDIEVRGNKVVRVGMCDSLDYAISIPLYYIDRREIPDLKDRLAYPEDPSKWKFNVFTLLESSNKEWSWNYIKQLLAEKKIIGQNYYAHDRLWLEKMGAPTANLFHDTLIAQNCLVPGIAPVMKSLSLAFMASVYTNFNYYKDETARKDLTDDEYGIYNCKDALVTLDIAQKQRMGDTHIIDFDMEVMNGPLKKSMDSGVKINKKEKAKTKRRLKSRLTKLTKEISKIANREINPNSPAQIKRLIREHYKIKLTKVTDDSLLRVMKKVSDRYLITLILEYRNISSALKFLSAMKLDRDGKLRFIYKYRPVTGEIVIDKTPFGTGCHGPYFPSGLINIFEHIFKDGEPTTTNIPNRELIQKLILSSAKQMINCIGRIKLLWGDRKRKSLLDECVEFMVCSNTSDRYKTEILKYWNDGKAPLIITDTGFIYGEDE